MKYLKQAKLERLYSQLSDVYISEFKPSNMF